MVLKLFCNVNIVYGNLKSENSQDYAQKPQRNCTFMNSASGQIFFQDDLNGFSSISDIRFREPIAYRFFASTSIPSCPSTTGKLTLSLRDRSLDTVPKIQLMYSQKKELRSLSSNSYIHVSVSILYIPRIGPHIWLQQNRQTDPGNIQISHRYMSV